MLDARIKAIEKREGRPSRVTIYCFRSSPMGAMRRSIFVSLCRGLRTRKATSSICSSAMPTDLEGNRDAIYRRPDGKDFDLPGAAQMIFSDLGTINVENIPWLSAYRFIRDELIPGLACPPRRSPSCRITRRPRRSSGCSAMSVPARSAF